MANALYAKGKQNLLNGNFDLSSAGNNVKLVLTDHGADTPNTSTDDELTDISTGTIATSSNLGTKSITDGVFDVSSDPTLTAVSGASVESVNIYKDSGVAATSWLLVYLDTGTNLPFTPNSGDVTVAFSNGASKIFAL